MTRKEFIRELDNNLRDIALDERIEAIRYYEEIFEGAEENGETEEDITRKLGSPSEIAREIIRQSGFVALTDEAHSQEQQQYDNRQNNQHDNQYNKKAFKQSSKKAPNTVGIILAVCLSPIWIGVLGGIFGVIAGIWGAAFGIVISLGAIIFSFGIVAVTLIGIGFINLFSMFVTGIAVIGIGLIFGALFFALLQPICHAIKWICVGMGKGTAWFCKRIAEFFELIFTKEVTAYE